MKEVFADAYYFLALANPDDQAHRRAFGSYAHSSGRLVTTVFVLAEVGDALSRPAARHRFQLLLELLQRSPEAAIVWGTEDLFARAVAFYRRRPDKEWSLTDCISFVVMEERGIKEALTGDRHFEQAGFKALLK
jgi:hypothetical protein